MPYSSREKRIEYKRNWNKLHYQQNKETEKTRIRERRQKLTQWLAEYKKSLQCQICGESEPVCLDFHHLEPANKDFRIGLAVNWGWGFDRIQDEIKKCAILCSNCHRKLHAGLIRL